MAGVAALLAGAGVISGCGGGQIRSVEKKPASVRPDTPVHAVKKQLPGAVVIVRDGDTGRRIPHALVHIGPHAAHTNAFGVATLPVQQRGKFLVLAERRGYTSRGLTLPFGKRRYRRISLYKPQTQWTLYGATPQRTQAHASIGLRPPFRVVWKDWIGYIEFPASVSGGIAYIANISGTVFAIRMSDGHQLWSRKIRWGKSAASPAVVGDKLVVHGMDGYVRVLDRMTGRLIWRYNAGSAIESSPIVENGVDYFGSWNGNVYALDLNRHRVRWIYRSGYKITSSASIAGGRLFIGDYGGRIWSLDPRNGHVRWVSSVGGRIYGTPAVAQGRVFVPSSDGDSLTAFSVTGRALWSIHTGSYVYSSPAVSNGRVYFGSYNGVEYCVSAASGRILWTYSSGHAISGAPTVVANVLYFANTGRRIYGLDARTGRTLMTFDDGNYDPVSGNGSRLLLHGFATLYGVVPR